MVEYTTDTIILYLFRHISRRRNRIKNYTQAYQIQQRPKYAKLQYTYWQENKTKLNIENIK